jgi:hypothetical protein
MELRARGVHVEYLDLASLGKSRRVSPRVIPFAMGVHCMPIGDMLRIRFRGRR